MKTPISEDQLSELSEICEGFSGREIKGVILESLLDKASKDGDSALFEFEDFRNRFNLKKEERKKLKEEADKELKAKITNALNRKAQEAEASKEKSDTDDFVSVDDNKKDESENEKAL